MALIITIVITLAIYALFRFTPNRLTKGIKAYESGDLDKAFELLDGINHKDALAIVAEIYAKRENREKALDLYIKAYDLGKEKLELIIAKLHNKDPQKAFSWYEKAANLGEVEAMEKLGDIYEGGLGVLQDYLYAHYWYNLASSRQSKTAQRKLKELSSRLTNEQIQKAQAIAKEGKGKKEEEK